MIATTIKTVKLGILLTFFLTVVYIYKTVSLIEPIDNIYLLAFAYTLTMIIIFAYNNITDKKEDKINKRKTKNNNSILIVSSILLASSFFFIQSHIVMNILIILALGILYSVDVKGFKIKKTFLLKNIYVSIIGCAIILLPVWQTLANFNLLLPLALSLFKIILLLDIIWDFKDIKGDRKNKVKTLPSVLGIKNTKIILGSIVIISFLGTWLVLNIINPFYILILLAITFINEEKTYWYYESIYYLVSIILLTLIIIT